MWKRKSERENGNLRRKVSKIRNMSPKGVTTWTMTSKSPKEFPPLMSMVLKMNGIFKN